MKYVLRLGLLILTVFIVSPAFAQPPKVSRYLVKFKYKGENSFALSNPSSFLTARSIARRTRYNIGYDSTDLPVTKAYIDSIDAIPTVNILNASKWLNQVSIQITDTSDANLAAVFTKINSFPFVIGQQPVGLRGTPLFQEFNESTTEEKIQDIMADTLSYGIAQNQVFMHNGQFLHKLGLQGQGMLIGVLDAGFQNYLTVKAFDSARANNQIIGTWDFVANNASVNEDNAHGMQCLSVMASNVPGVLVGTAPKSNYYLIRSEDAVTEFPIEEHNWVCAAERIDSLGGDLISSSLGYNIFHAPLQNQSHTYSQLNGNTTMVAIGADLAAKKGILVANSAGNEGNNSWGKIITPADGDSVLAVGAVNASLQPASFTSRGPSSDGQVKPDVASKGVATAIWSPSNVPGTANGTSFANPNMLGLTSCLWQGFPEFNNMGIINALRRSGSRSNNPNDTIGYGIPDMRLATLILNDSLSNATATAQGCAVTITFNSKDNSSMRYVLERALPSSPNSFVAVKSINATGEVFQIRNYSFLDTVQLSLAGLVQYRIRQVLDTSASLYFTGIIATATVNIASSCVVTSLPTPGSNESIKLGPNPTRGNLLLQFDNALGNGKNEIVVADAEGRLIYRSRVIGNRHTIPSAQWSAGTYFIRITSNRQSVYSSTFVRL